MVGLAALITILTNMPLFAIGALGPSIEAYGVTPSQLGIAVAAFTCAQAVAAAALGRVTDRARLSTTLRWSLLIAAISLIAIGTVQFGWYLLVAAAAIGGVGAAIAQPASSDYIVRLVSPTTYGRAFGILQASKPVTVLVLGLAVGLLASLRASFLVLLVIAAVLCLGLILVVPRSESRTQHEGSVNVQPLVRMPVIMLSACAALSLGAGTTMVSFLPLSAVDAGLHPGEIALLLALGSGIAIIMRVSVGIFADRQRRHPMVLAAVLLGIGAVGFALLAGDSKPFEFVGGVLAFAGGWGSTGLLYLAGAATGMGAPARVTGIMVTGGGLGSTVLPILFGMTATAFGYPLAWFGLAAIAVIATLAAVLAVISGPAPRLGVESNGA
ncbi:MAG: major facilitator superfamily 1 [Rhodoglobus sp.]|nr:major facilitator superfamily 1 [Rhodoglobus sp.]